MMKLFPTVRETIRGTAAALRAGETTCAEILESCIRNIERWEPKVRAWVHLDLEEAKTHARQLDLELAEGRGRGPLHGIPIGIKDIIDVKGMPTGCGSKLWANRIAESDARVVCQLRQAGANILGKTVTTAYAWVDPPVTRNPWDLERTPGGSSSGSAAAVACGMCLGAVGSQTGGSIIRPASFCGVAGLKPTFSSCCHERGVLPFAASLDHVGPIARSVGDLVLLFKTMFSGESEEETGTPTIALLSEAFWARAEPTMWLAIESAFEKLRAAGAHVIPVQETFDFDRIIRAHRTIMAAEAAANHRDRLDRHPEDYPERIRSLLEEGSEISAIEYLRAKQLQDNSRDLQGRACRVDYDGLFRLLESVDFLVAPATLGPAPDPMTTGDPSFNAPWSFFGLPTVTFPIGSSPDGLPLGIQLIGSDGDDLGLLSRAAWCERVVHRASNERGD